MSAHALNDDKRVIVLPDELESVFHVLLYFAIRFLQHNLSTNNVGHFLHDYFDAYCSYADGYRCGARKFEVMKLGFIDITSYNGALKGSKWKLQFLFKSAEVETTSHEPSDSAAVSYLSSEYAPSQAEQSSTPHFASSPRAAQPSSPFGADLLPVPLTLPLEDQNRLEAEERSHPLNHIIDTLLTWFKAYYEQDRSLSQRSKTSAGPGVIPLAASKLLQTLQRRIHPTDGSTHSAPSVSESEDAPRIGPATASESERSETGTRAETAALAKNLMSHDPILKLFEESLGKTWPSDDKGPDKKPRRGYVPRRDQIPTQLELNPCKKRKLAEEDAVKSKKRKASVH